MARLAWFTLENEIFRVGLSRLSQLTNESTEPVRVALVQTGINTYDLPFYACRDLDVFYDDVQQGPLVFTLLRGTGTDGQDQVELNTPPPAGTMLSAQTASGILTSALMRAILDGQGLVSDALYARGYARLAFDSATVPTTVLGWAWAIAEWKLVMGLKRAPLGDALRTVDIAFKEVVGGQDIEGHWHIGQLTGYGEKAGVSAFAPDLPLLDSGGGAVLADRRVFRQDRSLGEYPYPDDPWYP